MPNSTAQDDDYLLPQSDRLQILTPEEYELLWGFPQFSDSDRAIYFQLTPRDEGVLLRLRTPRSKAHFGILVCLNSPILGIVALEEVETAAIFPPLPLSFEVEVNADKIALISAELPTGDVFNYHTGGIDLSSLTGSNTTTSTLLPLTIR